MPSETLRKVTLNLYEDDIKFFEKRFGHGWSVELRRIMRREITNYQQRDELDEMGLSRAHRGDYS
jgi:hypothetical protein